MIRAELFLPQDLSNFLISKGFDWEVVGIYSTDNKIMLAGATSGFKSEHYYYEKHGAILWDQAEEWLRSKKSLSVEVSSFNQNNGDRVPIYQWEIRVDGEQHNTPGKKFTSHQLARIDGIEEAIRYLLVGNKLKYKDWVKKYFVDNDGHWLSRYEQTEIGFAPGDQSHYKQEDLKNEYKHYLNGTNDFLKYEE